METKSKPKLIVIADDEHRVAFEPLFRNSGFDLDFICEVSQTPREPLNPRNVGRYLVDHLGEYDATIICGCCADSLPMVTDKKIFPGKVLFFDYHQIHELASYDFIGNTVVRGNPEELIRQKVDLYVKGVQLPSVLLPQVNQILGL